jgi:hypothetical protein
MHHDIVTDILVFKTNIQSEKDIEKVSPLLTRETGIRRWNVDLDDIDRILRIESDAPDAPYIIELLVQAGYTCEELTD